MFRRFKKLKPHHQVMMALLIGIAVVLFWRGIWGIFDLYLFPENLELSMWTSIVLGLIILSATHYITKELM